MTHIVLTQEQAKVLSEAGGGVAVYDPEGRPLAFLKALDPGQAAIVIECKRRLKEGGPYVPSSRISAMLDKLNEIDGTDGASPEKVEEVVRRTIAGEPL
jgi:hypothetical protein